MITKIRKWFCPPHVCKVFRHYYGMNIKVCEYCKKEYSITNFILHQR